MQRVFQLMGWQVRKRAVGRRPRIEALPSVAVAPDERWSTDLCRIWGYATGADPGSDDVRLAVFSMVGQLVYFRLGQPLILRRMDWPRYDAAARAAISLLLRRSPRAIRFRAAASVEMPPRAPIAVQFNAASAFENSSASAMGIPFSSA